MIVAYYRVLTRCENSDIWVNFAYVIDIKLRDFPGSPVVKTPCSQRKGHGFDPWVRKLRHHMLLGPPHHPLKILRYKT